MKLKPLECSYFNHLICTSCDQLSRIYGSDCGIESLPDSLEKSNVRLLSFTPLQNAHPSRAKAKFFVGGTLDEPIIGFPNSKGLATEVSRCPLHFPILNEIAHEVSALIKPYKLQPYQVTGKTGELKGLIIQSNTNQSQIMLRFVLRSTESVVRIKKVIPLLKSKFQALRVVSVNIQPIAHAIMEGEKEIVLTEEESIEEEFCSEKFYYFPGAFSQVTPQVASKLYEYVAQAIKKIQPSRLYDLYSGVGCFSGVSMVAPDKVTLVETSSASLKGAQRRYLNKDMHPMIVQQTVDDFLTGQSSFKESVQCVVMNPPRKGTGVSVISQLNRLQPEWIFYSSCNAQTLFKDLETLEYDCIELKAFDMFPGTSHREVVATLKRK